MSGGANLDMSGRRRLHLELSPELLMIVVQVVPIAAIIHQNELRWSSAQASSGYRTQCSDLKNRAGYFIPSPTRRIDGPISTKAILLMTQNEFVTEDIKLFVRQQPHAKILETDILIPKNKFTKKEMDAIVIQIFCELYHIEFMDMRIQKYRKVKPLWTKSCSNNTKHTYRCPHQRRHCKNASKSVQHWDYDQTIRLNRSILRMAVTSKFSEMPERRMALPWIYNSWQDQQKFRCPVCHGIRATPDS